MKRGDFVEEAGRRLKRDLADLTVVERKVVDAFARGVPVSRDLASKSSDDRTFGERLADRVAKFGGSWTFIIWFGAVLGAWVISNGVLLTRPFDPYPFIFLNLMLSMVAAVQAPIIMMSQNRQAARDRQAAQHDYEVNLKAELEIMALHDKLDRMRVEQLERLLETQQQQIDMLTRLVQSQAPRD